MGGKSCLAMTFAPEQLPALGLVNPCLTAHRHSLSSSTGSDAVEGRVIHPASRQLRHSCNTWPGPCREQSLMSGTATTLWVFGSRVWIDRPQGRAVGVS